MIKNRYPQARAALDHINGIDDGQREEYRSLAERIPVMLTSNGLIQTILYLQGKRSNDNCHNAYLNFLIKIEGNISDTDQLLDMPVVEYRQLLQKVIRHCEWVKKFAKAKFPRSTGE